MKYQVTLHNASNIQVTFPSTSVKKIVDVDTSANRISESTDVDTTTQQDNGILVWNSTTQKHEYISPSEILDRADDVDDGALDYGTY